MNVLLDVKLQHAVARNGPTRYEFVLVLLLVLVLVLEFVFAELVLLFVLEAVFVLLLTGAVTPV